jgi:16S rRNA (uracil1498-N3)-methyltransferase
VRTPRFYTTLALADNQELQLEAAPSQHIARTLRMRAGDTLVLFNGSGGEYPADITAIDKRSVRVRTGLFNAREAESPLAIHLGIAMSRGDRMDWVVQKSTELGVARITPLVTARSELRLKGERAEKKLAHWQRVAASACEQCGRNRLPAVGPVVELAAWLPNAGGERRLVLHPQADVPAAADVGRPTSVSLLVGPEGGLDDVELSLAQQAGFQALQLGPRVLRTETAPLAAIALLQSRWGDMRLPS